MAIFSAAAVVDGPADPPPSSLRFKRGPRPPAPRGGFASQRPSSVRAGKTFELPSNYWLAAFHVKHSGTDERRPAQGGEFSGMAWPAAACNARFATPVIFSLIESAPYKVRPPSHTQARCLPAYRSARSRSRGGIRASPIAAPGWPAETYAQRGGVAFHVEHPVMGHHDRLACCAVPP